MPYTIVREDTPYEITPDERWCWQAVYTDGTTQYQFDTDGYHKFGEIRQDDLYTFSMISSEGKRPYIIHWGPGRKLIHFYLNYRLDIGLPTERFFRIYCFGYEQDGNKVILCIMPDDGVVITDDVNKVKVV